MKRAGLFLLFFLITNLCIGANKQMNDKQWFKNFDCKKLLITEFQSAETEKVLKQIAITDSEYIRNFQQQINNLPTSGGEMIKFGPSTAYLTLEFDCNGEKAIIPFYNSRIKTPDTSFYPTTDGPDKIVWQEIQSHLTKPTLGLALPKVRNQVYAFDTFTIEYLGIEDRTPKGTTATLNVETFKVVNQKDHSEQMLEVKSGQLPPRPQSFQVDKEVLVINTFTDKPGKRLNPRSFVIYRDSP